MSISTIYQPLQTESLLKLTLEPIANNFKTIDAFIKNFSHFQRKFQQFQAAQKATSLELYIFKNSTTNVFNTINQVLDTRNTMTNKVDISGNSDMIEMKKQIKEVRGLLSQFISDQMEDKQIKTKSMLQKQKKQQEEKTALTKIINEYKQQISQLKSQNMVFKNRYSTKQQRMLFVLCMFIVESLKFQVKTISEGKLAPMLQEFAAMTSTLKELNPSLILTSLTQMRAILNLQVKQFNKKLKLKAGYDDTLQLEDMILNVINHMYENITTKYSKKNQTKSALIFMEKRVNQLAKMMFGEEAGEKDALLVGKAWKCISCSKDLGEFQGKLDKFKAWSVFPTKQPFHGGKQKQRQIGQRTRYSGFGQGFQSVMETVITKKGGQINYDEKGRMTIPFNLTRQNQGNLLKPSQSQRKLASGNHQSPNKGLTNFVLQTNFMSLFGRNNETDMDIKQQYMLKQKGLYYTIKNILQNNEANNQ